MLLRPRGGLVVPPQDAVAVGVQRHPAASSGRCSSPPSRSSSTASTATTARLLYASIGASVMGVWSAVSTSGSGAVQRERWQGTLELLVAAPVPLASVLLPVTTAMATIGLYSMVTTLLWGRLLFGIDVSIEHPCLFVARPCRPPCWPSACSASCSASPSSATGARGRWATPSSCPSGWCRGFLVPRRHPARLGPADLVAAGSHLGSACDPRVGAGRPPATRPAAVPPLGTAYLLVGVAGRGVRPALRAPQREPVAVVTAVVNAARIFFLGGVTSYRALFNWLSPVDPDPLVPRRPDRADPAVRLSRPERRGRHRRVLRGRQRAAVRRHPVPVRDGQHDRRRAAGEDPRHHPVHAGTEDPAVPRAGHSR